MYCGMAGAPSGCVQVSNFSSNLFLTAAAQNLLCIDLAAQAGVAVSSPWLTWFVAAAPPCLVGMVMTPLALYAVRACCPPPPRSGISDASAQCSCRARM